MDEPPRHPSWYDDEQDSTIAAFRAKHAATIRRALALIAPASQSRKACRYDVETAIIDLEHCGNRIGEEFKRTKLAAGRLAAALRRVERLIKNENALGNHVHLFFPHAEIAKWRSELEKTASAKAPAKKTQKDANAKRRAVHEALGLMRHSSAAIEVKRGSVFCKLAALLYGKPTADLTNQCKASISLRKRRKK